MTPRHPKCQKCKTDALVPLAMTRAGVNDARNRLVCAYCSAQFEGTDEQVRRATEAEAAWVKSRTGGA